jgi:putative FmdB family regulatory protein
MPIYEYKCKKCGSEFEVFKKITDPDEKNCKFCNGPVSKLISLSSFQLQGSGWYVTDYAGKKPKAENAKKEEGSLDPKKEDSGSTTVEKN